MDLYREFSSVKTRWRKHLSLVSRYGYEIVTEMYAYVSFLGIIFTYGLETAFFRYSEKEKNNPFVYSTSLISILASSISLAGIIILFSPQISDSLSTGHGEHRILPQYI